MTTVLVKYSSKISRWSITVAAIQVFLKYTNLFNILRTIREKKGFKDLSLML